MLNVNKISIQFADTRLFKEVSFHISPHDRIGLVGPNGAGKTTLLKILAGITQPDSGSVQKANYVTIGYLPQEAVSLSDNNLYDEVKSAFENINVLQEQLEEINLQIANQQDIESENYKELLEMQAELQFKLECLDAHLMKSQIEKVLMGLGFNEDDLLRPVNEFSGGWQMRVALAKLLLSNPSLLLLDEPTNHLDLDSLRWLEEYLKSYKGAVILVSHDQAFLDNMTKKIFAIENCKLNIYHGNYSYYINEKNQREVQLIKAAKNQQAKIKRTQEFIERFRYKATKARQVQSRIKQLEKMDLIEIENDIEEIDFQFPEAKQSGEVVVEVINLGKTYSLSNYPSHKVKVVFEDLNFKIERGDRIALVGVNGSGKSTLTRILSGIESHTSGNIKYGHNVILSYFSQHQIDIMQQDMEVLQVAESESNDKTQLQIRTLLGCFLFKGDDVFKKVKVLSGGERSRLAIVKMLLKPSNFLIMDEPTNHLDMSSKKILQQALRNFKGTYLIVSHDRHFLDPIINKVMVIKNGKIEIHHGNISDYIQKMEMMEMRSEHEKNIQESKVNLLKDKKRIEAEARQRLYKLTKPIRDKIANVEKRIDEKEKLKQQYESLMSDPVFFENKEKVVTITSEYKNVTKELNELYELWTSYNEELEMKLAESKKS